MKEMKCMSFLEIDQLSPPFGGTTFSSIGVSMNNKISTNKDKDKV
jgi:hypothetical protein